MEVCATRILELAGSDQVNIVFELPAPDTEPGGQFACKYEISGLDGVRGGFSYGVDGVQALYLALCIVGAKLYTSSQWRSGQLLWNGANDLRFPVPQGLEHLIPQNQ